MGNRVAAEHNPLRMERIEQLEFRFPDGDWVTQMQRLESLNYRAAIVGRKGRGKSTLLRQLNHRLPQSRLVDLPHATNEHGPALRIIEAATHNGEVVLLDGIERLSWLQRQWVYRLTRSAGGLIVAVHRPCRLKTWIHCETDWGVMVDVLKQLGIDCPGIRQPAKRAFECCRGNIRDALRLLYDQVGRGEIELDGIHLE